MCGIVFAGGSLSAGDLEIFNQMLYCDVFRGAHATGIFAKRHAEGISFCKVAGEPYPFMHSAEYIDITQGKTKYVNAPTFVVGHNRHATRGNAGDAKNAHPFQHGNITLVHNGTLTDQTLLPDHARFVVDSENICYSIDKIGAADTIQKLDGAFTLIWHDASDDTLHIIRNEERPFHLARIGSLDWFGASEEDMLMWLLKRSKSYKNRISEHFECEVGVEYVFDVSGPTKRCTLKEKIKHDLPTFTFASRYPQNYSRYYSRDYGDSNDGLSTSGVRGSEPVKLGRETARASEREKQNAVAIEANIDARMDSRITMSPHSWFPYSATVSGTEKRGRITGWVYLENGEYYEVDTHAASEAMWEASCDDPHVKLTGTVVAIHKVNDTVRVVMGHPSIVSGEVESKPTSLAALPAPQKASEPALGNDDDVPFETDLPASFQMDNGMSMTLATWNKHDHSKCGGCDKAIPWSEAVKGKAIMAYNCFWHEKCLAEVRSVEDDNKDNPKDTFQCSVCKIERSMDMLHGVESAMADEDICDHCANASIKARRELENLQAVTKAANSRPKFATTPPDESQTAAVRVSYVDISSTAILADDDGVSHKMFTSRDFDRMIKMRDSEKALFADIGKCYIEKRGADTYAYTFKRGENLAADKAKEKVTSNVTSFSASVASTEGQSKLAKKLTNGNKELNISKALWVQIGQCTHCHGQIPWRDVEACALTVNNRVICPDCRGK